MSSKSSVDPRVRRSRQWLQDALKGLVQEQTYESITVQTIAARADVNRTTFYQHFRDKDELLGSIMSDLLGTLFSASDQYLAERPTFGPTEAPVFLRHLFEEVGKEAGFFRRMLGKQGSPLFVSQMIAVVEADILERIRLPRYKEALPSEPGAPPPTLVARFLALGLVGSLSWWLDNGPAHTAREAADWSWSLTYKQVNWDALTPTDG